MKPDDWQIRLQTLCNRFVHLGMGADLTSLLEVDLWGVYLFLSRLADG